MSNVVNELGKMHFEGNITPPSWFSHLRYKNGKPNVNAITVLAEIVYWYRPTLLRDEATGAVIGQRKKFKADKLQRSYQSLADQFGFTKRQARDAVRFLVDEGVITIEFRNISTDSGLTLSNVLFLEPVPEILANITYRHTYDVTTSYPPRPNVTPMPVEGETYTETPTKTTPETTTEEGGGEEPPPPPESAPPKPKSKKPKTKTPQAVMEFRKATNRYPPKSWFATIDQAVGGEADNLQFWHDVAFAYVGMGWSPTNVKTMLKYYKRREIPGENGGTKNATHQRPSQKPRQGAVSNLSAEQEAACDRIDAAL